MSNIIMKAKLPFLEWLFLQIPVYFILFMSVGAAIFMLLTDNDPPKLPNYSKYYSADCPLIKVLNTTVEDSRISIWLEIGQFLQFPRRAATSMMNVRAITGAFASNYNISSFWDKNSTISNVFFNILHPIQGETLVDVQCGPISISKKLLNIKQVNIYSIGYTRIIKSPFTSAMIGNGCWENSAISLFIRENIETGLLMTSTTEFINFAVNNGAFPSKSYAEYFNYTYLSHDDLSIPTVLIIEANPQNGFDKIIDLIIPVVFYTLPYQSIEQRIVLTHNQQEIKGVLSKIFDGEIQNGEERICYSNSAVISTSTGFSYDSNYSYFTSQPSAAKSIRFAELFGISPRFYEHIHDIYAHKQTKAGRIAVHESLRFLIPILHEFYPNSKIEVVNDLDPLEIIADIVSKSHIYVGSNLFNLAYSIFLNKDAHLVEYELQGFSNLNFGRKWAELTSTQYHNIPNNFPVLESTSFKDYFAWMDRVSIPNPDESIIKTVFDHIFVN